MISKSNDHPSPAMWCMVINWTNSWGDRANRSKRIIGPVSKLKGRSTAAIILAFNSSDPHPEASVTSILTLQS
nr:hypothetical protein [Okeania sp. SIO2B9]